MFANTINSTIQIYKIIYIGLIILSKKNPPLFTILSYLPWWVSIISGLVVYVCLDYVFPSVVSNNQMMGMLAEAGKHVAPFFGSLFVIPAIASIFERKKRAKLIAQQNSIESLKSISWQEFEILVGEAFRRKGYSVVENMVGGADGGIDLLLKNDKAETHIVQCKQWRKAKIGVAIVREMFGVLKASSAKSVYIVCSGAFTKEATAFASNLPITLIDGKGLLSLIENVQDCAKKESLPQTSATHQCPKCESDLVKRVAKKGVNKGNEFWGCTNFPKCRYTTTI